MNDDLILEALQKVNEAQSLLRLALSDKITKINDRPIDIEFLDYPLNKIDLGKGYTARANSAFNNYQILTAGGEWIKAPLITVRDLVVLSEAQLMRQPNFGRKTISRIQAVLDLHGLRLGMTI